MGLIEIKERALDIVSYPFTRHYEGFAEKAATLSLEDLKREITARSQRSKEIKAAYLRAGAVFGIWFVATAIDPRLVVLAGPAAFASCIAGPTRGKVRQNEREILHEELSNRRGSDNMVSQQGSN